MGLCKDFSGLSFNFKVILPSAQITNYGDLPPPPPQPHTHFASVIFKGHNIPNMQAFSIDAQIFIVNGKGKKCAKSWREMCIIP